MTIKIALIGTKDCEVSDDYDHEDEWERGDTCTSWYVEGAMPEGRVKDKDKILDTIGTNHAGTCYLVYLIYSTGDSFGHDSRSNLELVWVFPSKELAELAVKTLEEHNKGFQNEANPSSYPNVVLQLEEGVYKEFYPSWQGYFESLDEVGFVKVVVG
jgi:hypothetical protein